MKVQPKVFKFGGASLKDAAGVKNVASILQTYQHQPLLIVVSAMGKTTNALEEVITAHAQQNDEAFTHYDKVKQTHYALMDELFPKGHAIYDVVHDTFAEAEWVLEDAPHENYDYMYDQIIGIGELVSSRIVAGYLNYLNITTTWIDARDVLTTDDTYREAIINWDKTLENAQRIFTPVLKENVFVVTQGFIGSTSENTTTTLGREGSDYSAAIFSFCLDADSMTVWKDVPGVLNADPRLFDNVVKIDRLSYAEAIEMTYFGASVIHPKTVKPLQNKNIPLRVKSFVNPTADRTIISGDFEAHYPTIVIVEKNQTLLQISPSDYSFVVEHHLSYLFKLFADQRIFVNMMQNTALSFGACVTNVPDRIANVMAALEKDYTVIKEDNLELITVRHFQESVLDELKKNKIVLLEERIGKTVQMVVRNVPPLARKDYNIS
ncbi:MAG: aspartate kinase [Saprospiraceae bacterium]